MGRNHVRILQDIDTGVLAAVCDASAARVESAMSKYAVAGYTSCRKMFLSERLDAVIVAVPTSSHFEVAGAAMERGLHVLLEKPIAADLVEAERLAAVATQRQRILAIGHVERFNPAVQELKRRILAGELGRVLQIHARRLGPFPPRIRDVGVVIDLATHDLDVMTHLLEAQVVRLFAETERRINTDHEDMLNAVLKFENGTVGVLDVNWLTPTKVRDLSVLGERGMFHVNYLTQELRFYSNNSVRADQMDLPQLSGVTEGNMIRFRIPQAEPLRLEVISFLNSVAMGTPPEIGAVDGIRALRLAIQLIESSETSRAIELVDIRPRVDAYR